MFQQKIRNLKYLATDRKPTDCEVLAFYESKQQIERNSPFFTFYYDYVSKELFAAYEEQCYLIEYTDELRTAFDAYGNTPRYIKYDGFEKEKRVYLNTEQYYLLCGSFRYDVFFYNPLENIPDRRKVSIDYSAPATVNAGTLVAASAKALGLEKYSAIVLFDSTEEMKHLSPTVLYTLYFDETGNFFGGFQGSE